MTFASCVMLKDGRKPQDTIGSLRLSFLGFDSPNSYVALTVFSYIYLFIIGPTSNIVGIAYSSFFFFLLKVGIAYSFTHYKLFVPFIFPLLV